MTINHFLLQSGVTATTKVLALLQAGFMNMERNIGNFSDWE